MLPLNTFALYFTSIPPAALSIITACLVTWVKPWRLTALFMALVLLLHTYMILSSSDYSPIIINFQGLIFAPFVPQAFSAIFASAFILALAACILYQWGYMKRHNIALAYMLIGGALGIVYSGTFITL